MELASVAAVVESCCWGGGILLFGTPTAGPMVGAGVFTTWTGWALLEQGCNPKGENVNVKAVKQSFIAVTWRGGI